MDISSADLVGSAAGALTTVAFVPQVARAWRTKSVEDLSLLMLLAFSTGVALWVAYGVITHALPLVISNGVTLLLAATLLGMKLKQLRR
ncbi:MAG: SemiSWEET transporter [Vicinamibacterales bacterium]